MKKILTFLLLGLVSINCSKHKLSQTEISEFYAKINGSGFEPDTARLDKNATPDEQFYAIKAQRAQYDDLLKEMDSLFPSEFYSEEDRIVADRKYRSFIKSHSNEAFLPLLRKRYSKFMLEDFGILESENYNLVKYYTKELIETKTKNNDLVIKSLKKLKGKIPAHEFNELQKSTISILEDRQEAKIALLIKFRDKINFLVKHFKETRERPERALVNSLEKVIRKLEENTIACTVQEVAAI